MNKVKQGANPVIQSERRRLLIDATITAIWQYGLSNITLAKIAKIAGLTAGSVNFHFDNKDTLLKDTLAFLVEEFDEAIDGALALAGDDPAEKLVAIFEATLNPEISEPRKMTVWSAFSYEARVRDEYQTLCGEQDRKIFAITQNICAEIIRRGDKQGHMNARAMANAVQGLSDEIWRQIHDADGNYDREDARHIYLSFLASVFPWCYQMPLESRSGKPTLSQTSKSLRISRAKPSDVTAVSKLFDLYRQFYEQESSPAIAKKFIGENLKHERSIIFLATDSEGTPLGFTQLYPGLCSVSARPYLTLYDLYVTDEARRRGVGLALMQKAHQYARKVKASRIDLETAIDNFTAQALYESLGYLKDKEFYKYSLELT